ncbi:unnamed protein product [Prunus armeniaca]
MHQIYSTVICRFLEVLVTPRRFFFVKNKAAAATQIEAFVKFVEEFLEVYQQPNVLTFKVMFSHSRKYPNLMKRCIRFSVMHETKHLMLDFADPTLDEYILKHVGTGLICLWSSTGTSIKDSRVKDSRYLSP